MQRLLVAAFDSLLFWQSGAVFVDMQSPVNSKRERVIMLQPWGKRLLGTTLRYAVDFDRVLALWRRNRRSLKSD